MQHADVSAVANETDTATRGGITGEDRDSAAKTDRRKKYEKEKSRNRTGGYAD